MLKTLYFKMIDKLEEFVKPFYEKKDIMHDLSHIKRILKIAKSLSKKYKVDDSILTYGAYFHGIIYSNEQEVKDFLKKQKIPEEKIKKILQVSRESHKEEKPESIEGIILHDAHLLEGGKTFLILKSLIVGSIKGQSLKQIIDHAEKTIGKYKCYLPETQEIYREKEEFAKEFLKNLKNNL